MFDVIVVLQVWYCDVWRCNCSDAVELWCLTLELFWRCSIVMFDVKTILTSNIPIPHRQNNYNVKHHNTTPSEQFKRQTSQHHTFWRWGIVMFDVRIVLTVWHCDVWRCNCSDVWNCTVRTILTSNITIPHRQNNSKVKHHNVTPSEQFYRQTSQYHTVRTIPTSNITYCDVWR
jgi:hypothetical protein